MIREKIKAKVKETVLGIPVEVEKTINITPFDYNNHINELRNTIINLRSKIFNLERENEILKQQINNLN